MWITYCSIVRFVGGPVEGMLGGRIALQQSRRLYSSLILSNKWNQTGLVYNTSLCISMLWIRILFRILHEFFLIFLTINFTVIFPSWKGAILHLILTRYKLFREFLLYIGNYIYIEHFCWEIVSFYKFSEFDPELPGSGIIFPGSGSC